MKKLLAVLLACSAFTFAMTGCGDKKDKEESQESSSSVSESSGESDSSAESETAAEGATEAATERATTRVINSVEEGKVDDKLVGAWYNEYMGGSYIFRDDNTLAMQMDYSEIMSFKGDKLMRLETELDYEFDGKKVSVVTDYETIGMEGVTDEEGNPSDDEYVVLEMEKAEESDSVDGTYKLTGGEFYTMFETIYSAMNIAPDITIEVEGESFLFTVEMCTYSADGETLQMFGDGAAIFGLGDEEPKCNYTIEGDTLTLIDAYDVTDEFTKQ